MKRAKTPCGHTPCPKLVRDTYCDDHEPNRDRNRSKYKKRKIYKSARWNRISRQYLNTHPICEGCGRRASEEVDHITPLRDGGDKWSSENLQALCSKCHGKKSADEIDGFGGDVDRDKNYGYDD